MKKTILALTISLMMILTACAGQSSAPQAAAPVEATQSSSGTNSSANTNDNAVSAPMQLALGTLKLTGTGQAVTKEQAAVLLPLWKSYQTLSLSMRPNRGGQGQGTPGANGAGQGQGNGAPPFQTPNPETLAQFDSLVKQIQAAMTPDQLSAIAAMKITQASARTILQEEGITMGGGNRPSNNNQQPQGTPPAGAQNGGSSNGGAGGNPGGGRSGGRFNGGGMMVPSPVVDALVQTLAKISGDTSAATPAGSSS
jgi:hypothetical protein